MENLAQNSGDNTFDFVFGSDGHAGLSLRKVAELLNVSPSSISRLIKDVVYTSEKELETIKQQGFRGVAVVRLADHFAQSRSRCSAETKKRCTEFLGKAAIIGVQTFIDQMAGLTEVAPPQPPALPPVPTVEERLNIVERGMSLLAKLGGLDDRTKLAYCDQIRNITLGDQLARKSEAGAEVQREWTISDRIVSLGYKAQELGVLISIGGIAAKLYRKKHNGAEPPKRGQYVDGAYRDVRSYTTADLDIIDQAIRAKLGEPPSNIRRLPPAQ